MTRVFWLVGIYLTPEIPVFTSWRHSSFNENDLSMEQFRLQQQTLFANAQNIHGHKNSPILHSYIFGQARKKVTHSDTKEIQQSGGDTYSILVIRCHGYYCFHPVQKCGHYLRVATTWELSLFLLTIALSVVWKHAGSLACRNQPRGTDSNTYTHTLKLNKYCHIHMDR